MAFQDDEHRINNTGWIRNGDEMEGWIKKQNHGENAERFFNLHFPHQKWKQCLEFALAKLRRICKYLADAYNSNSHVCRLHCLTFVCENKAEKSTQWGESSLKNALKRAQRYLTRKMEKSPCRLNLLHCRQKTTTSLWNGNEKGIGETRKMRPQANSAQYNTQGRDMRGGGVKWGDSGRGGGGRLLCTNLYVSRVKWYDNTYTFQLY